jgi:hypothetical protein
VMSTDCIDPFHSSGSMILCAGASQQEVLSLHSVESGYPGSAVRIAPMISCRMLMNQECTARKFSHDQIGL